jgi:hypothetical protein
MAFFQDRVPPTISPGLALNLYPPDLCLLVSWDNKCEPRVPGSFLKIVFSSIAFNKMFVITFIYFNINFFEEIILHYIKCN